MSRDIRFSVVIILYNQVQYIAECIQSVYEQTYPAYELIIVDDGSTDGGGAYVRKEAEKYPSFIKVITQKNAGAFVARATGMKHVTGDYFIVIDSDDMIRQDTLEIVANRLQKAKTDIVLINYSTSSDFTIVEHYYKNDGIVADIDGLVDKGVYRRALATSTNINNFWLRFYKISLISRTNVDEYGARVRMGEDRIHTLILADVAESVMLVDEPLYYYRMNPDSVMHTYNSCSLEEYAYYCKVGRIFYGRWFDEKQAVDFAKQFEWETFWPKYLNPILNCHPWYKVRTKLDEILQNEYGRMVLEREVSKENPQANKILIRTLLNKNYGILFLYYIKENIYRSISEIVPDSFKQKTRKFRKKIRKMVGFLR